MLKGRKMYHSMKLQMAEFGTAGADLIFCANCSEPCQFTLSIPLAVSTS